MKPRPLTLSAPMDKDTTMETSPTDKTCSTCGKSFSTAGDKGRPREYCSAECRRFAASFSLVQSDLQKVLPGATVEGRRAIRRRLWSLANSLNRAGRA